MSPRGVPAAAAALALLVAVTACGAASDGAAGGSADGAEEVTVTVYAASSLTAPFTELGKRFEKAHEGVGVTFGFAGSADLVAQLRQGAPADVFASADTRTMAAVVSEDLAAGRPVDFAANTLQIVVPAGNPHEVDSLADLADGRLLVVVCAPEVPCGAAAEKVEEAAGVDIEPVSEEQSVTDVLTKVVSGEADAGLVYVTDVAAAGEEVAGVGFPESSQAVNTYPIVALADSEQPDLAREFLALVTGPQGRAVLSAAGFAQPR